ncbi:hypothetical protein DEO72_LG3g905 [Vigna unguiculata]|uniref:Uncharacterized protein n=1 Tax=Vigna unguiculata TaxID=3917 RepID=A0A4D6LDN9_VIGUN|nr:hypothetical protein DEO72_LG3g905 [Vigna unguiculata]
METALLPGFDEQVRVVLLLGKTTLLPGFDEQVRGGLLLGFGEQARVVVYESQGKSCCLLVLVKAALLPGFGKGHYLCFTMRWCARG